MSVEGVHRRASRDLPEAVRFALWYAAWLTGATSPDEARDGIVGTDAAHDVHGLPGQPDPVPVILALGALRSHGALAATVALPEPGDPLGLAGPAGFNLEALEAGQGVVLGGAGLGLVPARAGAGVQWRCLTAQAPAAPADPDEADRRLRGELVRAATALAELDVARWRPEVADELVSMRADVTLPLPPGVSPRTSRLLAQATRCRAIVALALADDGGAVSVAEARARRSALVPLDQAARRALVAACSAP